MRYRGGPKIKSWAADFPRRPLADKFLGSNNGFLEKPVYDFL